MFEQAGFVDVKIEIKENAKEVIKDWIPGSGAEKFVTSAYITATKPRNQWGVRDDPKLGTAHAELAATPEASAAATAAPTSCEPKSDAPVGC